MTRPLAGIKVLDFSEHGFVPSAAAALGDYGADVIKIERLQGDAMRTIIASGIVATKDGYDFQFELCNRNRGSATRAPRRAASTASPTGPAAGWRTFSRPPTPPVRHSSGPRWVTARAGC